jgi:hypothetical protein
MDENKYLDNLDALHAKLGDKPFRDPVVYALSRAQCARDDFNVETSLAQIVQHLVDEKRGLIEKCIKLSSSCVCRLVRTVRP